MTPAQWARVLRAGQTEVERLRTMAGPVAVMERALAGMAAEAERIAQDTA